MSEPIHAAWRELVHATRTIRRDPALAIGVILTLGLAIGANAAMFGLVTRLMLPAPPGVADPARVARVALDLFTDEGERYTVSTTSYPMFRAIAARVETFEAVAAV